MINFSIPIVCYLKHLLTKNNDYNKYWISNIYKYTGEFIGYRTINFQDKNLLIETINDNKEFFIEFYKNNKERFENNNLLALKLTKDKSDLDYLKKLTGLYDYEFKTGLREKQSEII